MRKTIAYFHLPGLFEAYAFYRVFLPLFFEHREYFYDWCAIGSLYGAPADCIWGGGRVGSGERSAQEVLALTRAYGLSARLTFSNSLLRPEHLSDGRCNALCRAFARSDGPQNGVIDLKDIAEAQRYYQAASTDANWTEAQAADVNGDGKVDMEDYIALFHAVVAAMGW